MRIRTNILRAEFIKHNIATRLTAGSLTIEEVARLATDLAQALIETLQAIDRIDNAPDLHGYDMAHRPYRGINKNAVEMEIQRVVRVRIPQLPKPSETTTNSSS